MKNLHISVSSLDKETIEKSKSLTIVPINVPKNYTKEEIISEIGKPIYEVCVKINTNLSLLRSLSALNSKFDKDTINHALSKFGANSGLGKLENYILEAVNND